jgi:hypothetical protein
VDALEIKNGFTDFPLKLWRIERVELKENMIWPICLSNEGNEFDFAQTQKYQVLHLDVSILRSSEKRMMAFLKQEEFCLTGICLSRCFFFFFFID